MSLVSEAATRGNCCSVFAAEGVKGPLKSDDPAEQPRWQSDVITESPLELASDDSHLTREAIDRDHAARRLKATNREID